MTEQMHAAVDPERQAGLETSVADSAGAAGLLITEKKARSILSDSKIHTYVLNPYVGCQHACSYCYARYTMKYTGHQKPWGGYVDVKINAPELLKKAVLKKAPGNVWISGSCDCYQPLESRYKLTRQCLKILAEAGWPVTIQTRSPLALRDLELFKQFKDIEVGFSIPTGHDRVREIFEPLAPPVDQRIKALKVLHEAGVRTYAMIAPMLPRTENLVELLAGAVDYILVDKLNYRYAHHIFKKLNREQYLKKEYFVEAARQIKAACRQQGIDCRVVFK